MHRRLSLAAAALAFAVAGAAQADHGNPWSGADDVVQSRNHDANQAFSADRPGDSEMHGAHVGVAAGKRDDGAAATGQAGKGRGGSASGGKGGHGGKGRGESASGGHGGKGGHGGGRGEGQGGRGGEGRR